MDRADEEISLKSYWVGFVLSLVLTVGSYLLVVCDLLRGWSLEAGIVGCGLLQAFVQFQLFLHLGKETKPRYRLLVFLFMLLVLVILVFGSLWIMHNLNYHDMPMGGGY